CSDSYKPKLNAVALIRQFPATAAETPSTAVDPVARGMATSITAAASAVAHALRQLRSRRSRGMSIPPRGNAERGRPPRPRVIHESHPGGTRAFKCRVRWGADIRACLEVDRGDDRIVVRTDAHVLAGGDGAADVVRARGFAGRRCRRKGASDRCIPDGGTRARRAGGGIGRLKELVAEDVRSATDDLHVPLGASGIRTETQGDRRRRALGTGNRYAAGAGERAARVRDHRVIGAESQSGGADRAVRVD